MTTQSDTPGEGLAGYCTDCEGKTIIRNGRCGCGSGRVVASDTAALPSGYEGLRNAIRDEVRRFEFGSAVSEYLADAVMKLITALGRVEPVAVKPLLERYRSGLETLATTFYKDDQYQDYAKHVLATPPAPQPALALSEDDLKQLVLDALEKKLEAVNIGPYGMHKGDWRQLRRREIADAVAAALAKRFKGE